jgi:glycine/D-amino acid oxidase-like deaminating enzyme
MTQQGKTVAVVGGGYGGAALVKALDEHVDVVLIEPKDAFVHAAGSLRALTQPEAWAERMFYPYDAFLKRGKHLREYASGVDEKGVTLASGERVEADYIVLATGSGYPYPAKTRTDSTDGPSRTSRRPTPSSPGPPACSSPGPGPWAWNWPGRSRPSGPRSRSPLWTRRTS